MKFLVDADLPRSTARALAQIGHDAAHVADIGLFAAPDRTIFDHAQAIGATLVTRDLDFTNPLLFPETVHCGMIIVRIRETLPPEFVNKAMVNLVGVLQPDDFKNAIIVLEENRFRRRTL